MKTLLTSVLLSILLVPAFAVQHVVEVSDFQYSPAQLTIALGDTVKFKRLSGNHPTASSTNAFAAFDMNAVNPEHLLLLTAAGSYPYFCTSHQASGMAGVITVNAVVNAAPALAKNSGVTIFPNPASEIVTISHTYDRIDAVKITNMIGQQVRYVRPSLSNSRHIQVNIADLPKGMYMVNLQSGGTTVFTRRLIKDR